MRKSVKKYEEEAKLHLKTVKAREDDIKDHVVLWDGRRRKER